MAAIGPIGVAGSQFLLSAVLLHKLSPAAFGSFAFLLVASQLSTSIWSALFCAPMPILLSTRDADLRATRRRGLMATNLLAALLVMPAFALLAFALKAPLPAALLFGGFAGINLLRWFGRAHAYANGTPWRTTVSDLFYAVILLAGVGLCFLDPESSLAAAYWALLIAATLGLLPFGLPFVRQQFVEVALRDVPAYAEVWRDHSGWSLTGVLTTEATGNAHAYIVTLISGATAFAPLAASALLMRPVSVASNALVDLERPQMARMLAEGRHREATQAVTFFRAMLILAWLGTVGVAVVLMRFVPHVLFPPEYDPGELSIATGLWLAIAGVRLLRTPESVLLQAGGQFKALAHASLISCGVSLTLVTAFLLVGGPVWSLVGVLLGEIVFAIWIWRQKAQWTATLSLGAGFDVPVSTVPTMEDGL